LKYVRDSVKLGDMLYLEDGIRIEELQKAIELHQLEDEFQTDKPKYVYLGQDGNIHT